MYRREGKYMVYESDIKHKNLREIDIDKAIWENPNLKEKYLCTDTDSVIYRIDESKKNNYYYLDLSGLKLSVLPNLTKYPELKKIKILFINNNHFKTLDSIILFFEQLEIIDISNNELETIKSLPQTIIEFVCEHNKLTSLPSSRNLKRLICSNNRIEMLSPYDNVEKIIANNNLIKKFNTYSKLKYLIICQNPLENISEQPNLTYLDCSKTNLNGKIRVPILYPLLKEFICHYTNIQEIIPHTSLQDINFSYTLVKKLDYMKGLKYLSYSNFDIQLDSRYKIVDITHDKETKMSKIFFKTS